MSRRLLSFLSLALALVATSTVDPHAQTAPTAVIDGPSTLSVGVDLTVSGVRSSAAPGATIQEYTWQLDFAPPVQTDVPSHTFAAASGVLTPGPHDVTLVVTDDSGNHSAPATWRVIVRDDIAPTAIIDAPTRVVAGRDLDVSGARSIDVGGRIVEYRWRLDSAPVVVTNTATHRFDTTGLAAGAHTVQLVVQDDSGNTSAPAAALVDVIVPDLDAPTAVLDAPSSVPVGSVFTLDGSRSSDASGSVIEYRWTVANRAVVATSEPTFDVSPLPLGTHTMQLVVMDDSGNVSAPAFASVQVTDGVPTAIIDAPATVPFGQSFSVTGARSFDLEGPLVEYQWTLDSRPPVVIDTPVFTVFVDPSAPLALGAHTIQLIVVDESGNHSAAATARVVVSDEAAPTAVIDAPSLVLYGQDIVVSGARSIDAEGGIHQYVWTLDGGAPVVTDDPSHTFAVNPAAPFAPGLHQVTLYVVDESGNRSETTSASVRVSDGVAPTAVIDAPATIVSGQVLTVSGLRSSDIGGVVIRYRWTLDGGAPIVVVDPSLVLGTAGAGALTVGRHTLQLVVTDDAGNESAPATAQFDVQPPPDTTPPTIVITTPANGGTYPVGAVVNAAFACTDADSGVATCTGTVGSGLPIDTLTIGPKSFTVHATDNAGNTRAVTHTYTVGFVFTGFFAPVDNLPVVNAGNAGRTIPIKWRLADGQGRPITALSSFVDLRDSPMACDAAPEDVLEDLLTVTTASTLHYDARDDQFIYHWRTVKGVVGCRLLQLTLSDGSKHWAKFRLR
jgi:PKD repeat protein